MKQITLLLIVLMFIGALVGCQWTTTTTITTKPAVTITPTATNPLTAVIGIKIGNLAPDFQLQDFESQTVTLSKFCPAPIRYTTC